MKHVPADLVASLAPPVSRAACVVAMAALALACAKPEVSARGSTPSPERPLPPTNPSTPPSTPGPAPSSPGPSIALPDAGSTPDLGPPPPAMPETCAEENHTATRVPLDVFLLLDGSGSMSGRAGTRTKLELMREAVSAFLKDPRSAGMGVALSFFPSVFYCDKDTDCPTTGMIAGRCLGVNTGCIPPLPGVAIRLCMPGVTMCPNGSTCTKIGRCPDVFGFTNCALGTMCPGGAACQPIERTCNTPYGTDCMGTRYSKPLVAFGDLPAGLPALSDALERRQPYGSTPLAEAVAGTIPILRTHIAAHPGRQVVLVVASDGIPDPSCGGVPGILMNVTAARMQTPPLPTYAIGVFGGVELGSGRMLIEDIARAGGTNQAYVIEPNGNLAEGFLRALNEIRGAALPCEFMIPPGKEGLDYGKLNLRFKTSGGGDELIGYVGSADRCDPMKGGWYYDVNPAAGGKPSRVLVCPATCAKLKGDETGKVELRFGCRTREID